MAAAVSIITVIRSIVETSIIPVRWELVFGHGERDWQNFLADKVKREVTQGNETRPAKVIYVDEPVTSDDTLTANLRVTETYPLSIVFGCKTEFDNTSEDHLPFVQQMRDIANDFVLLCADYKDAYDRKVFEITKFRKVNFINVFDANMSGCVLEITLKPVIPASICLPYPKATFPPVVPS